MRTDIFIFRCCNLYLLNLILWNYNQRDQCLSEPYIYFILIVFFSFYKLITNCTCNLFRNDLRQSLSFSIFEIF